MSTDKIKAAQAALEQAQQELRDTQLREREAAALAKSLKRMERRTQFYIELAAQLRKAGFEATATKHQVIDGRISPPSIKPGTTAVDVKFDIEWAGGKWNLHDTGRDECVIYPHYSLEKKRIHYKEKDCVFNWKKIVAKIVELDTLAKSKATHAIQKTESKNKGEQLAKQLRDELGVDAIQGFVGFYQGARNAWHERTAEEGKVFVKLGTYELDPDKARKLVKVMVELGLMTSKK